jgi:hypothetical protein
MTHKEELYIYIYIVCVCLGDKSHKEMALKNNKTGSVRINIIFRRVRVTIVAVESHKYYIF